MEKAGNKLLVLALCLALVTMVVATLPSCKDSEYHYEYTECGSDGGRWNVPVPHDSQHCSVTNKPLIRHKSCDSSCPYGQYMDVSTLKEECQLCPVGTFSRGGAVRYNNWTLLPPEFDAYSVKNYGDYMQTADETTCNSTWIADGYFLRTHGTSCITRLTYSTTIVQEEGTLSFWYYFVNQDNQNFEVSVRNEQCHISTQYENDDDDDDDDLDDDFDDERGVVNLEASKNYIWKNHTLKLKRGKNLVVWDVEHWNPSGSLFSNTVFIKDIEVKGVSFSSECAPCPAGRYADEEGSLWCKLCPQNQISNAGSTKCTACNEVKEYSPRGSSACLLRSPCKKTDYIETSSACDENNKFQTIYKWIEPKTCGDTVDGTVALPSPRPKKQCPPCNPGTYLNGTECPFCPAGTYSDGRKPCQKCPTLTAPVLSHTFRSWRSKPTSMEYWCSSGYGNSCSTPKGWLLRGDYLDSAMGHADDAILYFEIITKGFAGENGLVSRIASTVGMVQIDFELDCDGPCVFSMYEKMRNQGMSKIMTWNGRQAMQNYSYAVTSSNVRSYLWKFEKYSNVRHTGNKKFTYIYDRVKVYSVVITNTLDGGADKCRKCPVGLHESGCIECPEGHYVDKATKKCKPCDIGTYLSNNTCVKCGPGLSSKKGSSKCYSSCHYYGKNERHLDFAELSGIHTVKTEKSFLGQGTAFFNEYRINLCGVNAPPARCYRNVSYDGRRVKQYLNASICQMRIFPDKDNGRSLAADVAGIGHQLMGIYEEKPDNFSLEVFKDEKLLNESLLYFDYLSHTTTPSCPNGRSAWIILRCDSEAADKGTIKVPPECHEGTCDGCQFLFLWHTKHACPLCTKNDYYKIESGCANRKKEIHYSWTSTPKGCVNGVSLPGTETLACHDMTVHEAMQQFQILIGITAFVVTAIIAVLVFLWYKNRVLKYKLYHRVAINDSGQGDHELPKAESCVPDDDEDDERVEFRKGGNPGKKLFKKLKDISNKEDENLKLSESFEVDLS